LLFSGHMLCSQNWDGAACVHHSKRLDERSTAPPSPHAARPRYALHQHAQTAFSRLPQDLTVAPSLFRFDFVWQVDAPYSNGLLFCAASWGRPSIGNPRGAGASTGTRAVAGQPFRGSVAVAGVPFISAGGWHCPRHSRQCAAARQRGSTKANTSWPRHYSAPARPRRRQPGHPVVVVLRANGSLVAGLAVNTTQTATNV